MQKIVTFLWYDNQAEEAANFYISVFKQGKVDSVNRSQGKVLVVNFQLFGQKFMALNGGPMFKFNEAISLFVECETQAEVDELWTKLYEGGSEGR